MIHRRSGRLLALGLLLAGALPLGQARAGDAEACATIRMSDPGWTDINSTNAFADVVLGALGYRADIKTLSVPIGYQSLKSKDLDVFLGNWMPAQTRFKADLDAAKAVEVLNRNLEGAKFTLAVPTYVAEAGVKDIKDLGKYGDKFAKTIYGIEPGAPANANIEKIIAAVPELKGWRLVESGEQAMLAQVKRAGSAKDWIVFLAWAPHPMNKTFDLTYLAGGDDWFGPNYGGAEVFTLARAGWPAQCPNAATFFHNLTFTVDMENEMMGRILDDGMAPRDAAKAWLKAHPDVLGPWLANVTTRDGKPGLPAVRAALGL